MHVAHALRSVEREREHQSSLRANRMRGLELRDLDFAPSVEALAAALVTLHADRRVAVEHALIHGVGEQQAQNLQQIVGRFRRVRPGTDDVLDVPASEPRSWLIAVLIPKPLDDVPAQRLRALFEPAKFR
jgi:hypothetical protein